MFSFFSYKYTENSLNICFTKKTSSILNMKTKALLITGKTVEGGCSERKRPMFIISSKLSGM